MQIRPTTNTQTTRAINLQPQAAGTTATTHASTPLPMDQLEISPQAQMISGASSTDVRMDRIAEIRAQIADGSYDTSEKMNAAMGRLLNQFA